MSDRVTKNKLEKKNKTSCFKYVYEFVLGHTHGCPQLHVAMGLEIGHVYSNPSTKAELGTSKTAQQKKVLAT